MSDLHLFGGVMHSAGVPLRPLSLTSDDFYVEILNLKPFGYFFSLVSIAREMSR